VHPNAGLRSLFIVGLLPMDFEKKKFKIFLSAYNAVKTSYDNIL